MAVNNIEVVVQQAVTTSQVGLVAAGIAAGATIIVALINIYISLKIKDIEKITKEHEIRFSKLHEKRAEVIEELYRRLNKLNNVIYDINVLFQLIQPIPPLKNQNQQFVEAFNDFYEYYKEKKVYFGIDTSSVIKSNMDELYKIYINMKSIFDEAYLIQDNDMRKEAMQKNQKLKQEIQESIKEVAKLQIQLEQEFQKLLSVK